MKHLLLLLVLGGCILPLSAKQDTISEKRIYNTGKVASSPVIDGILNDEAWKEAEWSSDFTQYLPRNGKKPTFETRFKIIYDEDNIYVGIEAFDPNPDSIVTRLSRRDDLEGDYVFIDIDSYHDLRTCFAFLLTAGGVKGDVLVSNNGNNEDETWDPIWWGEVSIGSNSWFAEIKIPFSQLRFDNSVDGIWGIDIGRSLYRKDEMSLWQHIPADSPGFVHQLGELHGMKGIRPRKQAEVVPFVTGGIKKYDPDSENPFMPGLDRITNAGVDAKFGITNYLTLDVSVNPDFGQVEADPSVVNLTAYESFFTEKRPLFIEGSNIYNFPLNYGSGGSGSQNIFYSRRIGRSPHYSPELNDGEYADIPEQTNILAAAKLSGKTRKGTSIGILESVTAEEFATIDNNGERSRVSVEPMTNYFVGRVVQDMNEGNSILGGIFTSTYRNIKEEHLSFLPVSSTTGGLDFQQYWGERGYNIKIVNYFSHITGTEEAITALQVSPAHLYQRPDAEYLDLDTTRTSLSGYGGNIQFSKSSGNLNILAGVVWKSPGLDVNDLGYFRIGDEIMDLTWFGYNFYEPFSIFRRIHLYIDQYSSWDFGGYLALVGIESGAYTRFTNFWSFEINSNINTDIRYNTYLRGGPSIIVPGGRTIYLSGSSDDRKKLIVEPSFSFQQSRYASKNYKNLGLEIEYKPFDAVNFSVEPEFFKSFNTLQYVRQLNTGDVNRYIFASIDQTVFSVSLRANLTLSPELTIQYWGQPFIATGSYSEFKYITNGLAENYENRFHQFTDDEITLSGSDNVYQVSETSGLDPYTFSNPDFHISEFLSNMVIRWEYRPGSYLYAVWSQSRGGFEPDPVFDFGYDLPAIWSIKPTNVFLLKLSYRLGR